MFQLDFTFDDQLAGREAEVPGAVARDSRIDAALAGNAPIFVGISGSKDSQALAYLSLAPLPDDQRHEKATRRWSICRRTEDSICVLCREPELKNRNSIGRLH